MLLLNTFDYKLHHKKIFLLVITFSLSSSFGRVFLGMTKFYLLHHSYCIIVLGIFYINELLFNYNETFLLVDTKSKVY